MDSESVWSAIDLVPTLLDLSDTPHPEGINFDGESLLGTLQGTGGSRQAPLFFRRPPDRNAFYGEENLPDLAMRQGDWKLLCEYDGSEPQLYDLASDRGETKNMATENQDVVAEMTQAVLAWHQSMPADNGATYKEKPRKRKAKGK